MTPLLKTRRLILRKPKLSDAKAIFSRYAQDREVTKYLTWKPHKEISETKKFLRDCLDKRKRKRKERFNFAILKKNSKKLIGMIGVDFKNSEAGICYVLAKDEWNKGYMTEALKAIVDFSFSRPEIKKVYAVCDIENKASARVMEKAGLKREKILKRYILHPNRSSKKRDVFMYSLSRSS